jgi:hypothetical protein
MRIAKIISTSEVTWVVTYSVLVTLLIMWWTHVPA